MVFIRDKLLSRLQILPVIMLLIFGSRAMPADDDETATPLPRISIAELAGIWVGETLRDDGSRERVFFTLDSLGHVGGVVQSTPELRFKFDIWNHPDVTNAFVGRGSYNETGNARINIRHVPNGEDIPHLHCSMLGWGHGLIAFGIYQKNSPKLREPPVTVGGS